MSTKSETIRARIQPEIKHQAEAIFAMLGLSATDAISLYYNQVILRKGIPFEISIPNLETRKAIAQAKKRKGLIASNLESLRREFQ